MRMPYTIAELAKAAGVHVETIRYYHRRGLLADPHRSIGRGLRQYEEAHAHRLRFITRAQALGFNLDEVAELLALEHEQNRHGVDRIRARKLAIVRQRITRLRRIERELAAFAEQDRHGNSDCPLMAALTAGDTKDSGGKKGGAARGVRRADG